MPKYSQKFKNQMIKRMVSGTSANALSAEVGVCQPTLSTWLRQSRTVQAVTSDPKPSAPKPRRPEDWSVEEKLQAVVEAAALSETELGEWLRRKGLHEAHLTEWRAAAAEAFGKSKRPCSRPTSEARRIKELERELRRKDKALAETAALLVLRKKLDALLGDEDDATGPSSDKKSSH